MNIYSFRKLYERDLRKLKNEIELYEDEYNLWILDKEISNSAGNLCLHLLGNLNHFIRNVLGKINNTKKRELEFILDDIPRSDLIKKIEETIKVVDRSLKALGDKELQSDYPIPKFETNETNEFLLVHTLMHLNYHIGQINYHRRFLDN